MVCGGCRGGMYSDYDNSGDLAQQGNHRKIKTAEKRAQKKNYGSAVFWMSFFWQWAVTVITIIQDR